MGFSRQADSDQSLPASYSTLVNLVSKTIDFGPLPIDLQSTRLRNEHGANTILSLELKHNAPQHCFGVAPSVVSTAPSNRPDSRAISFLIYQLRFSATANGSERIMQKDALASDIWPD